jgi:hypothetical protein
VNDKEGMEATLGAIGCLGWAIRETYQSVGPVQLLFKSSDLKPHEFDEMPAFNTALFRRRSGDEGNRQLATRFDRFLKGIRNHDPSESRGQRMGRTIVKPTYGRWHVTMPLISDTLGMAEHREPARITRTVFDPIHSSDTRIIQKYMYGIAWTKRIDSINLKVSTDEWPRDIVINWSKYSTFNH